MEDHNRKKPTGWNKDPDEKVTHQLKIYVTEAEATELKEQAKVMGMSFSSFARAVLLSEELEADPQELHRIRYELNKIGVNLNQLTRKANEHGQLLEAKKLDHICQQLMEKLKQL